MTVQAILSRKGSTVITVEPTASIQDAAKSLAAHGIGALVVVGVENRIEGIISERDILRAISAQEAAALVRQVSDIMTRKVITCAPSDELADVMEMMKDGKLRHLPVLYNGRLVGIVSIRDVIESRLNESVKQAAKLEQLLNQSRATHI